MLLDRLLRRGVLPGVLCVLVGAAVACQNPFAPKKTKVHGREPVEATTPKNCMARLDYVMNEKDLDGYESLLDEDYWFIEPNQLDSLNFEWSKDVDIWGSEDPPVAGVKKIFEGVETLQFEFEEYRRETEHKEDFQGDGIHAHPYEDWEVFYGFVRMLLMKPDGDGFRVEQYMTFKLRYDSGNKRWNIIRWIDEPLGSH